MCEWMGGPQALLTCGGMKTTPNVVFSVHIVWDRVTVLRFVGVYARLAGFFCAPSSHHTASAPGILMHNFPWVLELQTQVLMFAWLSSPRPFSIHLLFCNTGSHGVVQASLKLLSTGSCTAQSWNLTEDLGTKKWWEAYTQASRDQLSCALCSEGGHQLHNPEAQWVGGVNWCVQHKKEESDSVWGLCREPSWVAVIRASRGGSSHWSIFVDTSTQTRGRLYHSHGS